MFIWNMEDMVLLNEKDGAFVDGEMIYNCESMVSIQEKIDFIDKMQGGKLSYLLGLIEQINKDKDTLKFDNTGYIKTVSLKAWIKKNDSRGLLDDWYKYGNFTIVGVTAKIQSYIFEDDYSIPCRFVDFLFHKQLKECEKKEKQYLLDNDEYTILSRKVEDKAEKYDTTFGCVINFSSNNKVSICSEDGKDSRDATIEELRELLDKYTQMDKFVEKMALELKVNF